MKKMPFSLEAEQSVLGAVLIDERVMQRALQRLVKEDFYKVSHVHIYDVMETLSTRKIDLDYATIISVLEERNLVDEVGGVDYLLELANMLPTAENVDSYIDIVKNKSLARQVIQMATNIAEQTTNNVWTSWSCLTLPSNNCLKSPNNENQRNFVRLVRWSTKSSRGLKNTKTKKALLLDYQPDTWIWMTEPLASKMAI
jgi:Replicative DNA helicase